jgi:hypothetical protein
MRESDFEELSSLSWAEDREELAHELAVKYTCETAICAFSEEGIPIAIGGIFEFRPNVVSLGFFATDQLTEIGYHLTRWIMKSLFIPLKEEGIQRIEAASMITHIDAHRWLRVLGLEEESRMWKYGKNGDTFINFAWIAE